eukprot:6855118-Pyramimonas_sp.AAC.1
MPNMPNMPDMPKNLSTETFDNPAWVHSYSREVPLKEQQLDQGPETWTRPRPQLPSALLTPDPTSPPARHGVLLRPLTVTIAEADANGDAPKTLITSLRTTETSTC